ncbi:MAG: sugar phosphate isomerase/epimerase [Bryobacterales bacterium]|nr:sugar phosphate isomerase/epimerase [Bryobacterales bacterium]
MPFTRRDLAKMAVAAGALPALAAAKPNSKFGGVQIGVITYSFRSLPQSAPEVLGYITGCGLSAIELMSNVPEGYAGAPQLPSVAGPRRQPTPPEMAAREKALEELKKWRLSVPMSKYKAFRGMYEDAGVKIYAFKLPPTMTMSDAEYEYIWNVAETLGANHITMELPTSDELLQRVAEHAAKRKLRIAFHTHGQGGSSGFEKALAASPYTALNLDVGHYYALTGESPIPIMEKYASRIASLHLKDRKGPGSTPEGASRRGGPNMPFGQGETPLREILQTMKERNWQFPGSIEYEYETPPGSNVLTEVKRCVQFCKEALS